MVGRDRCAPSPVSKVVRVSLAEESAPVVARSVLGLSGERSWPAPAAGRDAVLIVGFCFMVVMGTGEVREKSAWPGPEAPEDPEAGIEDEEGAEGADEEGDTAAGADPAGESAW